MLVIFSSLDGSSINDYYNASLLTRITLQGHSDFNEDKCRTNNNQVSIGALRM